MLLSLFLCVAQACQPEREKALTTPKTAEEKPSPAQVTRGPLNVILITADTMRGDVSALDGGPVQMPNLASMAQEGWHFKNTYSNSMLTTPSHISLMTSLYPRDHGVYHNQGGVHDGVSTLSEKLNQAGYFTAAVIGFPHLNPNVSNLGQGFNEILPATGKQRTATQTVDEGLKILAKRPTEKPFFVWLHMVDPHSPYESYQPGEHREHLLAPSVPMSRAIKAAPGFQKNNPWFKQAFKTHSETRPLLEFYNDEILEVDAGLGKLRLALKQQKLWNNTVIIFTSDHGENLGEHELYFHHGGLYEEAVKIPLVIRIPGEAKLTIPSLAQTVDIAPTIMGILKLPIWDGVRGIDLAAMVHGEIPENQYVFSEHLYAQLAAVRSLTHTLIFHRKSTQQFPSYPIEKDTYEFFNRPASSQAKPLLSNTDPAAIALKKVLNSYLSTSTSLTPKKARNQDMDSLKTLGYIE